MKSKIKTEKALLVSALILAAAVAHGKPQTKKRLLLSQMDPTQQSQPANDYTNDGRGPDAVAQPPTLTPPGNVETVNPEYSNRDVSNPAGYDRTKEQPPTN